ncbi:hypothetical protein FC50_GL002367 [Lacticaseibacillus pantheris DSM 15945 = JCM 12539 = NBRC 106106]|uniref:Uncharacterized protein n=1 Tax=Lacticaseibacillus pantheris DSM 15945 = JCM 12539 = NBRC 106106 TaxID=1423783 RepID=A0A0R1U5W9_9LACO|nr:hypothetical protein [Lacticaseibacillus pantheris]KRL88608.1 hypothetical protein FC50_GL002367 [Lacticaseibacillus pantheris DSM 15945 = JCM 12539 = NBRC 106106]
MEKVIDTYYLVKIGNGWLEQIERMDESGAEGVFIANLYNRAVKFGKKKAQALADKWDGEVVTINITSEDN